jgi:hypothetical protein
MTYTLFQTMLIAALAFNAGFGFAMVLKRKSTGSGEL